MIVFFSISGDFKLGCRLWFLGSEPCRCRRPRCHVQASLPTSHGLTWHGINAYVSIESAVPPATRLKTNFLQTWASSSSFAILHFAIQVVWSNGSDSPSSSATETSASSNLLFCLWKQHVSRANGTSMSQ